LGESLVKGVWFVTARRYIVEEEGEAALAAVAAHMPEAERRVFGDALPSEWFPESVLQRAMEAVQRGLTGHDDARFLAFIEGSTELGVNTFFRVLLKIASPSFLMRQMPAAWGTHRRDGGTVDVDADDKGARLHYAGFPFWSDRNYRLSTQGVLRKVTELCTGVSPRVTEVAHGDDWFDVEVAYGILRPTPPPPPTA
jgi:hypothetical protein